MRDAGDPSGARPARSAFLAREREAIPIPLGNRTPSGHFARRPDERLTKPATEVAGMQAPQRRAGL